MFLFRPCLRTSGPRLIRTISTAPTVLPRLRSDLKTALQTKNKARLSVLRGLLAEITNASKTDNPVLNDNAFFTLLKKRIAASQIAVEAFQKANRGDLAAEEEAQLAVLRDYAGEIDKVPEEELREAVEGLVAKWKESGEKLHPGKLLGRSRGVINPNGRALDNDQLMKIIEEVLEKNKK